MSHWDATPGRSDDAAATPVRWDQTPGGGGRTSKWEATPTPGRDAMEPTPRKNRWDETPTPGRVSQAPCLWLWSNGSSKIIRKALCVLTRESYPANTILTMNLAAESNIRESVIGIRYICQGHNALC